MSPSQLGLWNECQRKWAFRHVLKIAPPPASSALLGTETHKQLETVLSGGALDFTRPSGSGYIAAAALPLLPPPNSPGMELEKHFNYYAKSGIFHGYMDVVVPDSSVFPDLLPPGTPVAPAVSDHKTTGNFKYAKTPEDLRTDPQGVIYAQAAMSLFRSSAVDLVWTYILTKGARKAKRTHLRVYKDDVAKEFLKIEQTNSEIIATRKSEKQPLDLPPTTSACDGFGGCPYRHLCTDLSILNRRNTPMAQSTFDMMETLKKKTNGATVTTTFTKPVSQEDITHAPTPAKSLLSSFLPAVTAPKADVPVAINPPESLLPDPPETTIAEEGEPTVKAKRGRKPKAEMQASPTDEVPQAAIGYELFVDCFPIGENYTTAEAIYKEVDAQVKAAHGTHHRCIKYEGSGIFVTTLENVLQGNLYERICVNSHTPDGLLALSTLSAHAHRIVKGNS